MTKTELSTEALLDRRELAEKAAKRMPFEVARIVLCMGEEEREGNHKDEDDFLTSNDPNTVIATIDELLRLREENERLKEGLENALHVNELRLAEIAKTLITGLAEGITGDSKSVTSQIRATCVHCNASFTRAEEATAHDNVCPKHPANIRAGRLEKEIDWLAQAAANCEWMGRRVSPKFMREAARRAVESADE